MYKVNVNKVAFPTHIIRPVAEPGERGKGKSLFSSPDPRFFREKKKKKEKAGKSRKKQRKSRGKGRGRFFRNRAVSEHEP